jgi:predicted metal-dependent hydrolase
VQLGLPFDSEHDAPPPLQAPTVPPRSGVQFYFVRHRRARRYVLRVESDGRVRITIPRGGSRKEAAAFGLRHLAWITSERARIPESPLGVIERLTLRDRAMVELPARLHQLAARHGLEVSRVSVRDQRARWGSCGRDGHICLNWRLVLMPSWVRDYVLIHELMHLRRMDHSRVYWKLVATAYPDYDVARRWLREHGPSLR